MSVGIPILENQVSAAAFIYKMWKLQWRAKFQPLPQHESHAGHDNANNSSDDICHTEEKVTEEITPPFCGTRRRRAGFCNRNLPLWLFILNTFLFICSLLVMWKLLTPPPTNVKTDITTEDGKSFPYGQVTWSRFLNPLPCGTSSNEAIARGCRFDLIATAWLPSKCIDEDLVSEFESFYPWKYFRNHNGTQTYSNDPNVLGSQTELIWVTHRWHSAHCLFMWKKLNRALIQGRDTDGETIMQGHTDHCTKTILNGVGLDEISGLMEIIYPSC